MKKMRYIWLPMASACLLMGSCAEDYKETIVVPEKPVDVAMAERLASYDVLTEYASKAGIKVGVSVDPDDLAKEGLLYSVVHTNFNQVSSAVSMTPLAFLNVESEYDFSKLSTLVDAAALADVDIFGPALCSDNNIPDDYLKSLIADVIIPYQPWNEEIVVADFEDQTVGTKFPSAKKAAGSVAVAIADDPMGIHGKVLGGTQLTNDLPMVTNIKLPEGTKLKDVSRIKVKCLVVDGGPTTTRIQVESAGFSEKGNDYKSKNWEEYVFDMSKLKFKPEELELNTIKIAAGAYGGKVSCYIDDITIQIEHLTGDDTVISKTDEEKVEIIQGELDKWVSGVVETCGDKVKNYVIYDEPLDAEFASFHWADYLGDKWIANAQKLAVEKAGTDLRFYLSQSVQLNELMPLDIQAIAQQVRDLEASGVRVDGVNLVMDATYNLDYSSQVAIDAASAEALQSLSTLGKPVRIADLKIKVLETNGVQANPQNMSTASRQAVAEYYELIVAGIKASLGDKLESINFCTAFDTAAEPGLWQKNGDSSFIYEGVVKGLTK